RNAAAFVAGAVEFLVGLSGFRIGRHFDESKPLAAARVAVGDQLCRLHGAAFRKLGGQTLLGHRVRQIPHVELSTHWYLLMLAPLKEMGRMPVRSLNGSVQSIAKPSQSPLVF